MRPEMKRRPEYLGAWDVFWEGLLHLMPAFGAKDSVIGNLVGTLGANSLGDHLRAAFRAELRSRNAGSAFGALLFFFLVPK